MKIIKTIVLSDADIELLRTALPVCPCDIKCPRPEDRLCCCGCPDHRKYMVAVRPYEEAGILEYAKALTEIRKLNSQIRELSKSIDSIKESLPIEVQALLTETL